MQATPGSGTPLRPVLAKVISPMPPPGPKHECYDNSVNLLHDLCKDLRLHDELRFVAFDQQHGCGVHFVIEDAISVYDRTNMIPEHPHVTRVAKRSYWEDCGRASEGDHIVRLTIDQYNVYVVIMRVVWGRNGTQSLFHIFTWMKLVAALWDQGGAHESMKERVCRIAHRLCPRGVDVSEIISDLL